MGSKMNSSGEMQFDRNFLSIQVFYLFSAFVGLKQILYNWEPAVTFKKFYEPIWIIEIMSFLGLESILFLFIVLQTLAALLAVFYLERRIFRILFFICIFFNYASYLSDGNE